MGRAWDFLNTPDNFDGGAVRELRSLAVSARSMGCDDLGDGIDAIANRIAPLLSWYGALTNGVGHIALGSGLTVALVFFWREGFGEMPYRSTAFLCVFLPYLIGIEWLRQGWKSGDSWFDSLMVGMGSAGVLLPYQEVHPDGNLTVLTLDHRYLAAIMAITALLLFLRVRRRYVAS